MRKLLLICFAALLLFSCGIAEETTVPPETEVITTTDAVTNAAVEPIKPIDPPTLYTLSFIGAGDNMVYYGNVRDAARNAKGTDADYDFKPSYTSIKPIVEEHDIAFINQETLMCGEGYEFSYYPRFNSPQELGDAVVDAGFDIIGMANNHMLDKGASGLAATLDYWEKQPVTLTGAYRNEEAFRDITVIEKNGISIALLAFTEHTNGLYLRGDSDLYIPYAESTLIADMVKAAEEIADITVVSMHWGNEFTFTPSANQREWARVICENGGDVILGHHPHTIQPVEWIECETNKTLCVFSLGNFMSEMEKDYKILGGMISFDIEKLGEDGKAEIKNVLFIPTVFDYTSSFYNNHIYLLENYTAEQAKKHGMSYYGNRTTLEKLIGYVKDTIAEEFLPDFLK